MVHDSIVLLAMVLLIGIIYVTPRYIDRIISKADKGLYERLKKIYPDNNIPKLSAGLREELLKEGYDKRAISNTFVAILFEKNKEKMVLKPVDIAFYVLIALEVIFGRWAISLVGELTYYGTIVIVVAAYFMYCLHGRNLKIKK